MSGWSACGSIMDCVRSCYRSRMALYRDRPDVLTEGRWHFCPPGAKPVPYLHLFGSSNYDPDGRFDPQVGEVGTGSHPWSNGSSNPRLLGQNTCGSAEQWMTGSVFISQGTPAVDADGVPLCCLALPIMGGGDADGGECLQNWGFKQEAGGGDGDDGQSRQFSGGYQEAIGGDADDGLGLQYTGAYQLGDGGDADDGQGVQLSAYTQVGGGGDSDDGQGAQVAGFLQLAGGGDSEDGVGVQLVAYTQVAGGGDSDDGQGAQAAGFLQVGGGGDSEDGEAVQHGGWIQVGGGGDSEDGESTQETGYGDMWIKVTKTYLDFQVAGTTKTVAINAGAAKQFIHEIVLDITVAFAMSAGGPPTGDLLYDTVPITTNLTITSTATGYQADSTANAAKAAWPSGSALGIGSLTAAKPLNFKVTTTIGSLANLTAGSIDIWLNVSTLP